MKVREAFAPRVVPSYSEALAWLYGTQRFGIKLGLDNIRLLLAELRLPDKTQRIVHVAGTNGKGSVCAMIDAICCAAGYRTGLFTSPHLISFRERIQANGEMIAAADVATGLIDIRRRVANWETHPTFFEITTALALGHFAERECEIVVLETGMGGRLDATNAVQPVVSVITPVALDHQQWLGQTIGEIAGEKAGIIKPETPVVSAPQPLEVENVIRAKAGVCNAPLRIAMERYGRSPIALPGRHQQANAAIAIAALKAAKIQVDDSAIAAGLAEVKWLARFQRWDERTIIDGAHNPAGARVLAETWRGNFRASKATIILALLQDKDLIGIWSALKPIARRVILPHIRSERALSPAELQTVIGRSSPEISCSVSRTFAAALDEARAEAAPLLITGSLHFAGEALAHLLGDPGGLEDCLQ